MALLRAVTFDFGQTLSELDTSFLARRAASRGVRVSSEALDAAMPTAWVAYNVAKRSGQVASAAWQAFMLTLLLRAQVPEEEARPLSEWLWSEQPTASLWRAVIEAQRALVEELASHGVPLAIVSNSEGRLRELMAELDLGRFFPIIADSGVLGIEKPEPGIFEWTATRLGVAPEDILHVGDAWEADVIGATRFGARAFWYTSVVDRELPERVLAGQTAELRRALVSHGLLPAST